jgi:plastocyanin
VLETANTTVPAGKPVKLDSSKSTPGSGAIVGHVWDLDGNGTFETDTGTEPTVETTPKDAGPLTVQVRVIDDKGLNADSHLDLTVEAPPPKAIAPADPAPADPAPADPQPDPSPPPAPPHDSGGSAQPAAEPSAPPEPPRPTAEPKSPPKAIHAPVAVHMTAAPSLLPRRRLAQRPRTVPVADVHAAASSGVTIKNFAFNPASTTVHVGDTITWTNQDSAPHSATASDGSFDTGILQKGKSGSHTFTKAGSFAYICSVHPSMKATVTVAAASSGAGTSGGSSGGDTTTPSTTSADTGSNLPHTGLDLLAVVLLAGLMTGAGTLMRWRLGPAH